MKKHKTMLLLIGSFLFGCCIGFLTLCEKHYPHTEKNVVGDLMPSPGYVWDRSSDNTHKYAVKWVVNEKHPSLDHVYTSETEGSWIPEAGYGWIGYGIDSCQKALECAQEVKWCPDVIHPKYPHTIATSHEGIWEPEEGYQFCNKGSFETERVVVVEKIVEKIIEKEVPKTIVKYVEKKKRQ